MPQKPRVSAALTVGGNPVLTLLWVLLCAAAIIAFAYLFTRYVAGRGGMGLGGVSGGTERFRALARLSLGREHAAVLVQAGDRYLLLGIAPSGVSLLAELTKEEAEALIGPPKPPPPSFREALHTVLQQRKQR